MSILAILGASGHGKVVAEIARSAGWDGIVFYDDAWPGKSRIGPWSIVGDQSALVESLGGYDGVVVAIGCNSVRASKLRQLQEAGARPATLIHPSAIVSISASIGSGTVVMANAVINADAVVGSGAILNTACSVDHDCVLGDAVHVSPGAHLAGNVRVGDRTWLGIGAAIRQGAVIGSDVTVGAGAAVVSDIADGLTVVGVPARILYVGGS